jgi:hypothetical protein
VSTDRLSEDKPTGGGSHTKLVLVRMSGETWAAMGSLNGVEIRHKLNFEVPLLTDRPDVYARLIKVLPGIWKCSPHDPYARQQC